MADGTDSQLSMFGSDGARMPEPPRADIAPSPELARRRLGALLETARQAERMPWSERDLGMWQIVFPQMTNWLPADEAEQMRFAFAQELDRLRRAA